MKTIKDYNIIGICGYGNSGTSAFVDLLKGSDELQVDNKSEWQILHNVDGILDLKHYLVNCKDKIASNTAIKRYERSLRDCRYWSINKHCRKLYVEESLKYSDALKCFSWRGYSAFDAGDVMGLSGNKWINRLFHICRKIGNILHLNLSLPPTQKRYFSLLTEEEFNYITYNYLTHLFERIGYNKEKPVILEQFFVFSNPELGHEFFKSAKTILVERDPRDVYANSKFSIGDSIPTVVCRFMPTDNVANFVEYFKRLHIGIRRSDNVYIVKFEDLIFDYENTVEDLCKFLNIKKTDKLKKYFHIEISIKNTKFYKNFPEIREDIKYIEDNLPDYLSHYVD